MTYHSYQSCFESAGEFAILHEQKDQPSDLLILEIASLQIVVHLSYQAKQQQFHPYKHSFSQIQFDLLSKNLDFCIATWTSIPELFDFSLS